MTRVRPRVLFVAEAVTLAQVVRLTVLARALPARDFEVHFAAARFDELAFAGTDFRRWIIHSLAPEVVERRVAAGKRVHDARTLAAYLDEDRRLLDDVRPDLVVGDLRLSLSVAAPLAGVPYAALINAYWSPQLARERFPMPDHPMVRLFGEERAARYFPLALPRVFAHFARPVNALRRKHGLSEIGSLPDVLTHGDLTLFPDVPEMAPMKTATAAAAALSPADVAALRRQRFLGPLAWSPRVDLPDWWDAPDPARPTVYVTLGSSGRANLLPAVLEALAPLGVQVLLSTAGRPAPSPLPPHVFAAPFLPGDLAARRAALVISNGGSSTGYQALGAGRPVIGVAFNLDQYLAMDVIARAGAGVLVRAGSLRPEALRAVVRAALDDPALAAGAARAAETFARYDPAARFRAVVAEVVGKRAT